MRRKFGVCVAVVSTAALIGSPAASANGRHKQDSLRLVATQNQEQYLDLGAPGPSLGDELIFSEVVRKDGREVGKSGVVCTLTEAEPPYEVLTFQCVATLSLKRGQITLQGLIEVQGADDRGRWRSPAGPAHIAAPGERRS